MTLFTSNFDFLKEYDPIFFELANTAEQVFASDPNTTLIKLRQLGEAFAKDIAARCGIYFDDTTPQVDLIHQIDRELRLDPTIRNLFHTIRVEGNKATHEFKTEHREALNGLKMARSLAVWYHQSFGKEGSKFNPGSFIAPSDPSQKLRELQNQINQLRASNEKFEDNQQLVNLLKKEKQEYAVLAEQMDKEARTLAEQVKQQEEALLKQRESFETHIRLLQIELVEQNKNNPQLAVKQQQLISDQIKEANQQVFLTEELARLIIDQQLTEAGWQADSLELTWDNGARPEQDKNKAIAGYPIFYQGNAAYADYILFCGMIPIAVIEAKCENINVADKIRQAETYAKGFQIEPLMQAPWLLAQRNQPWTNHDNTPYIIPFVYSSNGRPYNTQLEEKSGTWFRDLRETNNLAQALQHFHTPQGLLTKLSHDISTAEQALQQENFAQLYLRSYQQAAIQAVEKAILNNQRNCLIAMATGTGKTVVINALIYRFLKTNRFKRILVLVDHAALGLQTEDILTKSFDEQYQTLAELYNLAELSKHIDNLTNHLQLATVQGIVKSIFASDTPPSIDSFDCIIIDEAHSGYMLEQEMIEGELATRNSQQYIKEYQQLINYFDAVKIGLTATPVKHTTDIFGKPVYCYSYREAVADDYLIDYEPPILYQTELTQHGIHFNKGYNINIINAQTGNIETTELEDELSFDIETFNRFVINKSFNEIICEQLVQELNPFGKEKTLIFCASDLHADMVKNLLDKAFTKLYQDSYDQTAVAKITIGSYNPKQLITAYKTERYPNIAITVDLLATAIDVPQICNLVFLRHVKSRILFEQMLGRANRRCDEIGKTVFRIYDPIGICQSLQEVVTMQPLQKTDTPLINLLEQFTDNKFLKDALNTPSNLPNKTQADLLLDQICQKIMRILRRANYQAEHDNIIKEKLDETSTIWGIAPYKLHNYLQQIGAKKAADFFKTRKSFLKELREIKQLLAGNHYQIISEHTDKLINRSQLYGQYNNPKDFLDSFKTFIQEQIECSKTINKTLFKPNNITKAELKEIRLILDNAGYSETNLQIAWRNQYHQIIDAGLIGYIRYAAIDEPLIPFENRVEQTLQKVHSLYNWTPIQRQWLNRLAEHLIFKEVLDRKSINKRINQAYGSSIEKLDQLLNGQLNEVLTTLKKLWPESTQPTEQEQQNTKVIAETINEPIESLSTQPKLEPKTQQTKSFLEFIKQFLKIK